MSKDQDPGPPPPVWNVIQPAPTQPLPLDPLAEAQQQVTRLAGEVAALAERVAGLEEELRGMKEPSP